MADHPVDSDDAMPSPRADTRDANRRRRLPAGGACWLFGYGSLIFRTDFAYLERRHAVVEGWVRRFWQGSHDHRGTPDAPGRVATLVRRPGTRCHGMAYRVTNDVFAALDHREKNGYLRLETTLEFTDGSRADGVTYVATPSNAAWLGPAPEAKIAAHIAGACGPSGKNADYLLDLSRALRDMGVDDPHVGAIERFLVALRDERKPGNGPLS